MPRRLLLVVGLEIGILVAAYLYASHAIAHGFGLPLDDSWIYAVFARNLAEGRGMVYNPGQYSSPTGVLYGLMLGGMYKIAIAPVAVAAISGVLLHLGATVLVYGTARQVGLGGPLSAGAAVAFAATPRLIWGALSGMEVPLYVFLVALGIYWQVRWKWYDGPRAYLATVALAFATLTRPECGTLFAASILERLINSKRFDAEKGGARRYARTIPAHVFVFAGLIAPWVAFNLWATGLPLPPSFYAKTGSRQSFTLFGAGHSYEWVVRYYLGQAYEVVCSDNLPLAVVAVVGCALCFRWAVRPSRAAVLLIPLAALISPSVTGIMAHEEGSIGRLCLQWGRYSSYLVPLAVIAAGIALASVWPLARRRITMRLALAAVLILAAWGCVTGNNCAARRYASDVGCINSMQVSLGRWAARLPKGTVLAVNDAGAIPYFSRKEIIDTVGVTDPRVIPYLHKHKTKDAGLVEYLSKRKPSYLIIFPTWYGGIAAQPETFTPVKKVVLKQNTVCGGGTMIVYLPPWGESAAPTGAVRASLKSTTRTQPTRLQAPRQRRT